MLCSLVVATHFTHSSLCPRWCWEDSLQNTALSADRKQIWYAEKVHSSYYSVARTSRSIPPTDTHTHYFEVDIIEQSLGLSVGIAGKDIDCMFILLTSGFLTFVAVHPFYFGSPVGIGYYALGSLYDRQLVIRDQRAFGKGDRIGILLMMQEKVMAFVRSGEVK
jgi:hypothetical protein